MTDENTPTPDPEPQAPESTPTPEGDEPLGEAGTKALKAERERAAAAERQARALAAQLEEATSSRGSLETQLAAERTRAEQLEIARLRADIAWEKGLPRELVSRLQGSDAETIAADADELLRVLPARTPSRTPQPDPSQGARIPAPAGAKAVFEQWARTNL